MVFSEPLLDTFRQTLAAGDVVRYRCYEVAVGVACQSRQGLALLQDVGLLPELVQEAFGRDILVQLNALELLTNLGRTEHGFEHLQAEGVTPKLEKMLTAPDDSTFSDYLLPGLLKFFGQLGHARPERVLSAYPGFTAAVLAMPAEPDPTRRMAAMDTIACLGMSPAGKLALGAQGAAMTACVTEIGALAQNATTELRLRALETIHHLLKLEAGDLTEELLALTQAWFAAVSAQPLDLVWGVARQPFLDLRLVALSILAALAGLPWGQRLLFSRAGFLEFLLNRTTESNKEGRDGKLDVICAVLDSPSASGELSAEVLAQLTSYREQGSFYVRAHTEVALEEA